MTKLCNLGWKNYRFRNL